MKSQQGTDYYARAVELRKNVKTKDDLKQSFKLFWKAYKSGNNNAIPELARFYLRGGWVKRDFGKAIALLQQGAELGIPAAQAMLGATIKEHVTGIEPDKTAIYWIKKAAASHYPYGEFLLAEEYFYGSNVRRNIPKAISLYKSAVDAGLLVAYPVYAKLLLEGKHVEKDEKAAFELFQIAAKHDDGDSMYYIGYCYENGIVVEKSLTEAVLWYKEADVNGSGDSFPRLMEICGQGETQREILYEELKKIGHEHDAKIIQHDWEFYNTIMNQK